MKLSLDKGRALRLFGALAQHFAIGLPAEWEAHGWKSRSPFVIMDLGDVDGFTLSPAEAEALAAKVAASLPPPRPSLRSRLLSLFRRPS